MGLLAATAALFVLLVLAKDFWASPGHWWFGGSNQVLSINNHPQGDYDIYRALNGDLLVICWDHMTEYYVSLNEQKVWEVDIRQLVTFGWGIELMYFRHSLTNKMLRDERLKLIAFPQFQRETNSVVFTDSLNQQIRISL